MHLVEKASAEHGILGAHEQSGDDTALQHLFGRSIGKDDVPRQHISDALQFLLHVFHVGGLSLGLCRQLLQGLLTQSVSKLRLAIPPL